MYSLVKQAQALLLRQASLKETTRVESLLSAIDAFSNKTAFHLAMSAYMTTLLLFVEKRKSMREALHRLFPG